jgi:hypothetical protein
MVLKLLVFLRILRQKLVVTVKNIEMKKTCILILFIFRHNFSRVLNKMQKLEFETVILPVVLHEYKNYRLHKDQQMLKKVVDFY